MFSEPIIFIYIQLWLRHTAILLVLLCHHHMLYEILSCIANAKFGNKIGFSKFFSKSAKEYLSYWAIPYDRHPV